MIRRNWPVVALVLASVVIGLDLDLPVIRPVLALVTLLGVPTLVLFRRVGFPADSVPARALYAFGSSLLGLILLGLLVNTALPLVGVDRPLQPLVLAVASLLVNLALLRWRADRASLLPEDLGAAARDVVRRAVGARAELAQALAVASVVLAIVGAVRLNNGAGGGVALTALVVAAAALLALMVRPEGTPGRDARSLALVATSLLLATSLRGWSITGHDVQSEYLAFLLTDGHQHWQVSLWDNAYNACLSVTILPSVLAQTTGLSGVVVFKLLLQLVFALVPVLTFLLGRRYLPRRLALASAVLTMALPTFYTDMPYLVRQEIAFFFLALLLLAATAPDATRGRLRLVAFFGLGVVLSHYSTTYVLVMGLLFGLLALGIWRLLGRTRWLRRDPEAGKVRGARAPLVLLSPLLVGFLVAASWVWAGPVTHTGGHASEVAREAVASVLGRGEKTPGSSDLSWNLFSRDRTSPRERLDLYVAETLDLRKQAPPRELLIKHPGKAELRPEILAASKLPLTGPGRVLDSLGLDPGDVATGARLVCAGLMQVFLLLGLVWILRRRKDAGREVPEEAVFLSIGAVAAVGLIVLIPKLSVDYGVLRAFQQTLLVVAPVMAAGMWLVVRTLARRAIVLTSGLTAVVPLLLLLVLTGALPSLVGGYSPRLALSNSGLYYDRYFASDSDVQAVDWIAEDHGSATPPQVIANRNINVRILSARNDAVVADRLFPTLLTKGEYVVVDSRMRESKRATVFYTGDLIGYAYPMKDLDQRLNIVYSSDLTRIYR